LALCFDPKIFFIWDDNVIPRVDDVTFLEKNNFILLLSCLLPFRNVVYVLIFEGYFIM